MKLPKPKLVFWPLKLYIFKGIIAFLVIVLADYLACVLFGSIRIKSINPNIWSGTFSFLFLYAVVKIFLLFFFTLLNNFFDVLKYYWPSFLSLRLKLFSSRNFYKNFLIASFFALYRLFVTGNALIYLP